MTIFASKSKKGFFDPEIHSVIPQDAVELPDEYHATLMEGQANGLVINFNTESGVPNLVPQPELTLDQKKDSERKWRNEQLSFADIELNKVQDSDPKAVGTVEEWCTYRKLLRVWPEHTNFPDTAFRPVAPSV